MKILNKYNEPINHYSRNKDYTKNLNKYLRQKERKYNLKQVEIQKGLNNPTRPLKMDECSVACRAGRKYRNSYGGNYSMKTGNNLVQTQNNLFIIENVYMDDDEGIMRQRLKLWETLKYFNELDNYKSILDNYKSISEFRKFLQDINKHRSNLWETLYYIRKFDNYKSITEFKKFVSNDMAKALYQRYEREGWKSEIFMKEFRKKHNIILVKLLKSI